jgi:hypothetical protein
MKKKDKEIIHKPDMLLTLFTSTMQFIRNNSKQCIAGFVIFLIAIAAGYAYMLHLNSEYDKIQYKLTQGIQSFNEYNTSGKQEDIVKAESIFNEVAQKNKKQSYYISRRLIICGEKMRMPKKYIRKFSRALQTQH